MNYNIWKNIFIWRKKELEEMSNILKKTEYNSILLVWDVWVGKTTLLEEFIRRKKEDSSFDKWFLQKYELYKLIKELKEKWYDLYDIKEEIKRSWVILIIDDINVREFIDDLYLFEIIKERDIQKIFVVNYWQLSKIVHEEESLISHFEKLEVRPIISSDEIKNELLSCIKDIQLKYKVAFSNNVLELIISYSEMYLSDKYMPYRVLNIIDLISSWLPKDTLKITEKDVIDYFWKLFWNAITFKWEDSDEENQKLLELEQFMSQHVIWHKAAIKSVCDAIRIAKVWLMEKDKPLSSFFFLWPTGTGKTEICKALALSLYWDKNAMLRIDCSEYSTKESIYKLIWSPPGTFWYEAGWLLTNAVIKNPNCIILFDELEKSLGRNWNWSDLVDVLLPILDEWHATDSKWTKVSFRNTIIIMTSNVGAKIFQDRIEFKHRSEADERLISQSIEEQLGKVFRPEFLNRIDETIVFWTLNADEIKQIAELKLRSQQKKLKVEHWINVEFDWSFVDYLAKKWFDPKNGWRPIRRVIMKELLPELTNRILTKDIWKWDDIKVNYSMWSKKIIIEKK